MFNFFSRFKPKAKVAMGSSAANDAVRTQLAALGDNGSAARHVVHYAYPANPNDSTGRPEIVGELRARGLKVSDAGVNNGLVMEHTRSVAADDFDAFTGELHDYFAQRNWEYDGWECALVAAEDAVAT